MILSHFSETPLILDVAKKYAPLADGLFGPDFKPRGLWLSDESDYGWKEWCESNDFRLEALKCRSDFKLKNLDNIIVIKSKNDLNKFTTKFGTNHGIGKNRIWIDWELVTRQSSGIIITPYLWECRLMGKFSWYYPWDCASACIWDLSLIEMTN